MKSRIVTRELKPAQTPEDFRLHCAALEWSLAEPIIINEAADIRSRVDWKDRVEPFRHQVQNLMRFCRRLPVTLLADDVGLGKTISAGLIVSELMKRNRISKVFVVCPKILIPQWVEELEAKFGIKAYGGSGAAVQEAAQRPEPVFVTTYHSAARFLEDGNAAGFDMLILDEAHKVRNLHGTANPPRMASAIYDALESRAFKYVLMLTATPIQNRLWDIYSLVDCLAVARGHTNPFGAPEQFASRFIADGRVAARRLKQEHADEFRKIVNSYMFRTRRLDAELAFPEREVKTYPVTATPEEAQLQAIIAESIQGFGALEQINLLVALMSSPQALAKQLENMAARGNAPANLASRVGGLAARVGVPAKAAYVLQIAAKLSQQRQDWRMVIFTTRRETQLMLGAVLKRAGISHGFISGGRAGENRRTIEDFRKESPDIHVIVSTDAGAEGVNLQAANILVNYDLPWNPMIVEQRIGRVQRIGSRFKTVWVANVVHHNSPEQRIVGRLMEKLQVIAHTVGDIEAVLEAAGDAEGESLEQQIREMVIASLRGQDQEEAARLAAESIEQARSLLEEQQEQMNAMLGEMNDPDQADIPMPRLESAKPSMPLSEFVVTALEREGCRFKHDGHGLYAGRDGNQEAFQFTFDPEVVDRHSQPGVFMGRGPHLYQPGKPAFERLVQRWIDQSAVSGADRRCTSDVAARIAQDWVGGIQGARFVGLREGGAAGEVHGRVICRARVANAVDSYEKILAVGLAAPLEAWNVAAGAAGTVHPKAVFAGLESLVEASVAADSDVQQFRRFYEQRLARELAKSDTGERRDKLVNDLAPSVTAEAAALEFEIRGSLGLEVAYRLRGDCEYRSRLEIEDGRLKAEPPRGRCELTAVDYPEDCLEICQVTGKRGLRELMGRSDVGGGYAFPGNCQTCSLTGKKILETEAEKCAVTGQVAARAALRQSELSGRFAVPQRTAVCELTGARLIDDELMQSAVSGKWFRRDEAVRLVDGVSHVHRSEAVRCDVSGEWLLESETAVCPETGMRAGRARFAECAATGEKVLPAGLAECCLSGAKVRKSLLEASAASGRVALASRMCACAESGAVFLPEEVAPSEVSEKVVDKRLLRKCTVTGTIGTTSELVKSAVSGTWLLPEHTVALADGKPAGRHEVALCQWTDRYLPLAATAQCRLSGVRLDKRLLNASGEFGPLREVLDGTRTGKAFPDQGFLARSCPEAFRGISGCDFVTSVSKQAHILFGTKSLFGLGLGKRVFAVIALGELSGLRLVGNALFGKRTRGVWVATEVKEVNAA